MLSYGPSPIQQLDIASFTTKNLQVWVKRDDLIHPFISGNKSRKLKYLLLDAAQKNQRHLVTFGGAFSNHLLATAAAAAENGFRSTGFARGEPVQNDMLLLCRLMGMDLRFVSREDYRDKQGLFYRYFFGDTDAYFIAEGAAGELGALGCEEIVTELPRDFDHIICACGTGTTVSGILNGLSAQKKHTRIHVVPILKDSGFLKEAIDGLLKSPVEYNFHSAYHFGGYAKTDEHLIDFIKKFIAKTGILIDPVYTGKAFYALFDLIEKGVIKEGGSTLVIHTGGTFGLLGMREKFFPQILSKKHR
ncbi:MAG: 1-aminocyclopropane-1-carboxylate deaminase/D-cysteine desulfhydrase [Mucilaginibacter polytrichastri]|nr:1-aminocyclopropane-1-carboxylate deaminase/D-cysteine desulfhydrase [Mucilaginibacter polytrichastri]